ncbi:hypothetical protein [Paracoccus sp. SSK6]|uniref:hypothetical protein n=1 Tax=Paracoccus sp. SSK6 TaxID=3143131 RepID=UPI00321962B7
MRTPPFHECARSEKRLHGYWLDISRIHRADPEAQSDLHALDKRLDTPGYSLDLRSLRAAVRSSLGPAAYRLGCRGESTSYETPVHIYALADIEGGHVLFDVRVSFDEEDAPAGYDYIGAFQFGDIHSMNPDIVREDRLYRHYVWPLRERRSA